MRENVVSIIKQRRLVTYHTSRYKNSKDSYKVCVWLATGIRMFLDTRQAMEVRDSML